MAGPTILNASQPGPEFVRVTTEDEVCDEIARQSKAGIDMIKVYSGLRPPLLAAALRCAHERGLPVVGHLQATTWTEAAELGIDAITHGAPWAPAYLSERDRPKYDGSLFGRIQRLHDLEWIVPGLSLHQEMLLMRDAGMRPIDVLKAATANAAIALGKAGTFGRIGAGARADIVVLDRNPLADLRDTRAIRMVIKDGRVVERR